MLPENLKSERILISLQLMLCRKAAVKCLHVYHLSADYIFSGPFGIIGLILNQFENKAPLKPVLGVVGRVALLHYCT